jgi:hypothetical protein
MVLLMGNTLMILDPRISILILLHNESKRSIVSMLSNSQDRALNAYGFEVKAPIKV